MILFTSHGSQLNRYNACNNIIHKSDGSRQHWFNHNIAQNEKNNERTKRKKVIKSKDDDDDDNNEDDKGKTEMRVLVSPIVQFLIFMMTAPLSA